MLLQWSCENYVNTFLSNLRKDAYSRLMKNLETLPLAVVGTLFGIYSYCSSNNSEIQNAKGAMSQTLWKQLKDNTTVGKRHSSLSIIVIAVNGYSGNLNPYLDLIYNALLFYVGSDALESMRSQELLRKNLKVKTKIKMYRTVNSWLNFAEEDGRNPNRIQARSLCRAIPDLDRNTDVAPLLYSVEFVLLLDHIPIMQTVLEFATEIQSFYVCLFASYRIAAATDDWWSLSGQEIALIVGYMRTEKRAEVKDVPVYLHIKSPQMAVRLMWCRLSLNCVLVALCGLNPTLDVFISTSKNLFKKCISSLKNAESTYPFNVPPHIILDTIVLGYLVMDRESNRAVSSFCPHRQPVKFPFPVKVVLAPFVRMKLLRDAHYQVVLLCREIFLGLYAPELVSLSTPINIDICSIYFKALATLSYNYYLFLYHNSSTPHHSWKALKKRE
nr:EOG090X07E6 [Artemia franciscana]